MSKIQLQMDGLDEFCDALRRLPQDLADEAATVVLDYAQRAQREVQNGYPVRTTNLNRRSSRTGRWFPPGILKARVTVLKNKALVSTSALVQSRAPHAWIYENGTRNRSTDKGYDRGEMPEAPVERKMIPKVVRIRAQMKLALIEIVRRAGFEVNA